VNLQSNDGFVACDDLRGSQFPGAGYSGRECFHDSLSGYRAKTAGSP